MGDIVEEMDTHRRKSFALLTRKGADGRCELEEGEPPPVPRASRSFSKVALLRTWQTSPCVASHLTWPLPYPCRAPSCYCWHASMAKNCFIKRSCFELGACVAHS